MRFIHTLTYCSAGHRGWRAERRRCAPRRERCRRPAATRGACGIGPPHRSLRAPNACGVASCPFENQRCTVAASKLRTRRGASPCGGARSGQAGRMRIESITPAQARAALDAYPKAVAAAHAADARRKKVRRRRRVAMKSWRDRPDAPAHPCCALTRRHAPLSSSAGRPEDSGRLVARRGARWRARARARDQI